MRRSEESKKGSAQVGKFGRNEVERIDAGAWNGNGIGEKLRRRQRGRVVFASGLCCQSLKRSTPTSRDAR